jgi:hypothetical protein
MTPTQYRRLVPLFEAAMKLPAWQRVTFAKGHCGDDPQLLYDLLALLKNAELPADSLDRPVGWVKGKTDSSARRKPPAQQRLMVEGYQIVRSLGRGGMGKVYEAIDRKTGATVAIKFIRTRGAFSEDQRLRFLLEARGMALMRHPNIVELYDIGQTQGNLYLVMEYLRGRSLRSWLSEGPRLENTATTVRFVLQIMGELARALAFAHAQGFVHGDVKPENIMVLDSGATAAPVAKLIDFGLVRQETRTADRLGGGGTPPYMDPELFRSAAGVATPASDVWALGVTLIECLTGKRPFANAEQAARVAHHRLSQETPMGPELNALLDRVLAKKPAERLKSAEVFAEELERLGKYDGASRPTVAESQREAYALPDLELSQQSESGPVAVAACEFFWRKKQLGFHWRPGPVTAVITVNAALLLMLANLIKNPYLYAGSLCSLIGCLLLWFGLPIILPLFCAVERRVFCSGCGLAMGSRSTWMRFVMEKTEAVYGRGDCIAALKHGLWEEAAKMISIHGKESTAKSNWILSPARFRLEFFECDLCGDQAARLTAEELERDVFRPRADYFEAYRRNAAGNYRRVNRGTALRGIWEMAMLRRRVPGFEALPKYFERALQSSSKFWGSVQGILASTGVSAIFIGGFLCLGALGIIGGLTDIFITPPRAAPPSVTAATGSYYSRPMFPRTQQSHPLDVCVAEVRKSAQGAPVMAFHPYRPRSNSKDARLVLKNYDCRESQLSISECRVYCQPK